MALPDEYLTWNARLLDYCLDHGVDENGHFTLAVHEMLGETGDPAAETEFTDAVRRAYAHLLTRTRDPLSRLISLTGEGAPPLCVAFLGLAVLASEEMHANEYYEHLARLLGQPQEGSSVHGFVHTSFERCWMVLNVWLQKHDYWMDRPEDDGRRYIRWPKMHALLRLGDVEKLPRFFREYGISPLRHTASDRLSCLFSIWIANDQSGITKAGVRAWRDGVRQRSIVRQIVRVLDQWDEKEQPAIFRRASAVRPALARLVLDICAGKPAISVRARRPDGFPNTLASGIPGKTWRSAGNWGEDVWYEDMPLSGPGLEYLPNGFETPVGHHRVRFRGAQVFVFGLSEFDQGFEAREEGGLPLNAFCAVLCRSNNERAVSEHLRRIAAPAPSPCALSNEWTLFHSFRPILDAPPPQGLESLCVTSALTLRFCGGLPASRRLSWLEGAPPERMEVHGRTMPERAFINDKAHPLTDGTLCLDALLQASGEYEIKVGSLTRRVVIEPGRVKHWEPPAEESVPEPNAPLTSPQSSLSLGGPWMLLGATAGEIAENETGRPAFPAQWAIKWGLCGQRAAVSLVPTLAAPKVVAMHALGRPAQQWAEAILATTHPRLGSLCADARRCDVHAEWSRYVSVALRIRRDRLRRARDRREGRW